LTIYVYVTNLLIETIAVHNKKNQSETSKNSKANGTILLKFLVFFVVD